MKYALLFLVIVSGCKSAANLEETSESTGYRSSELRNSPAVWAKAKEAVGLLEKNGWCTIPKGNLPRGYTHSDLIRQMACVANKESTFGQDRTGPGDTGFGVPYGYWQVVTGHLGQSAKGYKCPNVSVSQLRDNFNISAQCALYVYMAQGIGAWEAKCHRGDWQALRSDGQPIFPIACGDEACTKGIVTKQEGRTFKVTLAKACEANFIEAIPLEVNSSNVASTGKSLTANLALSGTQKVGIIDLNGLDPKYDKLRILVKQGSQTLWTSNPSPSINLNGDGASSQDTFGGDPSDKQGTPSPTAPVPFPAAQPQIVNPPK
jgi:hypothetical protein